LILVVVHGRGGGTDHGMPRPRLILCQIKKTELNFMEKWKRGGGGTC